MEDEPKPKRCPISRRTRSGRHRPRAERERTSILPARPIQIHKARLHTLRIAHQAVRTSPIAAAAAIRTRIRIGIRTRGRCRGSRCRSTARVRVEPPLHAITGQERAATPILPPRLLALARTVQQRTQGRGQQRSRRRVHQRRGRRQTHHPSMVRGPSSSGRRRRGRRQRGRVPTAA